jgi:hypothetical protein
MADIDFAGTANQDIENLGIGLQGRSAPDSGLFRSGDCPEESAPDFQVGLDPPTGSADKSNSRDRSDVASSKSVLEWVPPASSHFRKANSSRLGS